MTPAQFIADRIVNGSQRVDLVASWLDEVAREAAAFGYWSGALLRVAVRHGYCVVCHSVGSTLVGDVDVSCRECVPVADPMDVVKERIEG